MCNKEMKKQFLDDCLKSMNVDYFFYYKGVGMPNEKAVYHCWAVACFNVANDWLRNNATGLLGIKRIDLLNNMNQWAKPLTIGVFNTSNPRSFERKIKQVIESDYPDFYQVISKCYGSQNARKFTDTLSQVNDFLCIPKNGFSKVSENEKQFALYQLFKVYETAL